MTTLPVARAHDLVPQIPGGVVRYEAFLVRRVDSVTVRVTDTGDMRGYVDVGFMPGETCAELSARAGLIFGD